MQKGDKISDSEYLLRRAFYKDKRYVHADGTLSPRAFAPRPKDEGKLSVDIESLVSDWDFAINDITKFRLYKIEAALPHSLGLTCNYDPLTIAADGLENPAHGLIIDFPEEDESLPGILSKNAVKVNYPSEI
jgi:hypothetical protein